MFALCETLIAGGDCLVDVALLRADSAQALLRGHGSSDVCERLPPFAGGFPL